MPRVSFLIACVAVASFLALGQEPSGSAADTSVVQGVVQRTNDGAPVSGAQIRLLPVTDLPDERFLQTILETSAIRNTANDLELQSAVAALRRIAVTDNNGRFRFSDVRPGPYSVIAQREGFFVGTANSEISIQPHWRIQPPSTMRFTPLTPLLLNRNFTASTTSSVVASLPPGVRLRTASSASGLSFHAGVSPMIPG